MTLTIGSLFSGIGGLELGLERAGLGPVLFQVEKDPFCLRVLAKHWPNVTRFDDVCEVGATSLPRVDVLCGGFPCQDVSAAGHGAGLAGARSGLWYEFARIIGELCPRFVVVENVTSGKRRWLPAVRQHLHVLGYNSDAFALSAADLGAPHVRRRVFVVAHALGMQLRHEPRRGGGTRRERAALASDDGEARAVADTESDGRPQRQGLGDGEQRLETGGRESDALGGSEHHRGWWSVEPNVGRVAHGVPARVDRLRSLGNAVVPQCAEAVGRMIVEMAAEKGSEAPR